MTFTDPDWPALWRDLVERSLRYTNEHRHKGPSARYTARLLRAGKPQPGSDPLVDFVASKLIAGSTVIDIGAAAGRWSLRLAAVARSVTAIEPSAQLCEALRQNIATSGVGNVAVVESSWQKCQLEPHDAVINSHAMYGSADLVDLVESMQRHSRQHCFMVMRAYSHDGAMAELSRQLIGHRHDSPNFEVGYNVLLAMGIAADVVMDPVSKHWTDDSLDDAVARAKRHLYIEPSDGSHDGTIRSVVSKHVVERGGKLHWRDQTRSALMWWRVD